MERYYEESRLPKEYEIALKDIKEIYKKSNPLPNYTHSPEGLVENLKDWSLFYTIEEVKDIFNRKKAESNLQVEEIPLNALEEWQINKNTGNVSHKSEDFFTVHGLKVRSEKREITKEWTQPILTQVGYDGGILGIIRKRFGGIPHYLCEFKEEPGNYGKVQISPTLQATFANLRQAHGGRKPHFSEFFIDKKNDVEIKILFDAWLAEDGGRLHLKRNKGMLIEIDENFNLTIPSDDFIWLSLYQIKNLLQEDAWINPHIRGVIAHV